MFKTFKVKIYLFYLVPNYILTLLIFEEFRFL